MHPMGHKLKADREARIGAALMWKSGEVREKLNRCCWNMVEWP